MTPIEKAQEILGKMNVIHYTKLASGSELPVSMHDDQIKQCALTAVNEIIGLDIFDCNCEWSDEDSDTREYWQEVKLELEKL